eukprot:356592-Chlamydomonas_euryale.AAC.2
MLPCSSLTHSALPAKTNAAHSAHSGPLFHASVLLLLLLLPVLVPPSKEAAVADMPGLDPPDSLPAARRGPRDCRAQPIVPCRRSSNRAASTTRRIDAAATVP